jgi:hypothetical protein
VSHAKAYYLEQLKDGPVSHRIIMNRMSTRFNDSPANIKDALVKEGYIVCVKKVLQGNGKYAYYHQLTGKSFVAQKQQATAVVKQDQPTDLNSWEDGTAKSTGNAFDWRSKNQGIFTKAQIAQMQQKQVNKSFPITTFSRA